MFVEGEDFFLFFYCQITFNLTSLLIQRTWRKSTHDTGKHTRCLFFFILCLYFDYVPMVLWIATTSASLNLSSTKLGSRNDGNANNDRMRTMAIRDHRYDRKTHLICAVYVYMRSLTAATLDVYNIYNTSFDFLLFLSLPSFPLPCPIRSLTFNISHGVILTQKHLFLLIFRWNLNREIFVFWWERAEQERQRWWNFCSDSCVRRRRWFFSTKKISRDFHVVKYRRIGHVSVWFFRILNSLIGWRSRKIYFFQ